jgi:hypothetical protein
MDDPASYDDLEAIETAGDALTVTVPPAPTAASSSEILLPEHKQISMPSAWTSTDNIYRGIELELRISQAKKTLQGLRDTIADKSFQYSHVIRVAPRKGVHTRARAAIAKLNHLIAYYSRVYTRCRAAMLRLGAGQSVLNQYRILLKQDVKSSSALLNPNLPGSTTLKLSWIWQNGGAGNESTPESLHECEYSYISLARPTALILAARRHSQSGTLAQSPRIEA